jgi:hypothetical protein
MGLSSDPCDLVSTKISRLRGFSLAKDKKERHPVMSDVMPLNNVNFLPLILNNRGTGNFPIAG